MQRRRSIKSDELGGGTVSSSAAPLFRSGRTSVISRDDRPGEKQQQQEQQQLAGLQTSSYAERGDGDDHQLAAEDGLGGSEFADMRQHPARVRTRVARSSVDLGIDMRFVSPPRAASDESAAAVGSEEGRGIVASRERASQVGPAVLAELTSALAAVEGELAASASTSPSPLGDGLDDAVSSAASTPAPSPTKPMHAEGRCGGGGGGGGGVGASSDTNRASRSHRQSVRVTSGGGNSSSGGGSTRRWLSTNPQYLFLPGERVLVENVDCSLCVRGMRPTAARLAITDYTIVFGPPRPTHHSQQQHRVVNQFAVVPLLSLEKLARSDGEKTGVGGTGISSGTSSNGGNSSSATLGSGSGNSASLLRSRKSRTVSPFSTAGGFGSGGGGGNVDGDHDDEDSDDGGAGGALSNLQQLQQQAGGGGGGGGGMRLSLQCKDTREFELCFEDDTLAEGFVSLHCVVCVCGWVACVLVLRCLGRNALGWRWG
jgi:hypothetical protein